VDGRIILDCILGEEVKKLWTGLIWLRRGNEHGNETSGSVKPREYFD
jgi:hypothetical protein